MTLDAQQYITIGAILTALSVFFCFLGDSCTSEIDENTQIAFGYYIHGIAHYLDDEIKNYTQCWNDGTNLTIKYSDLNFKRRGYYYLGNFFLICSIIMYAFSFRAVSKIINANKIATEKAEADRMEAEKAESDRMEAESLQSYV